MPSSSSDLLREAMASAAWAQWTTLGVLGTVSDRESRSIDPEALVWVTFASNDVMDARLVGAAREWLGANKHLISMHRLRNMFGEDTASLDRATSALTGGGVRSRVKTATKAVAPDPLVPANLAIRLRLLMDAGARSEVARFLLTRWGLGADAQAVASAAFFAKRNVNDILLSFVGAGVVEETWVGNRRTFQAVAPRWCSFLGVDPTALPEYVPWMRLFRSAAAIVKWFADDDRGRESAYMRSSSARQLVETIRADLAASGVTVPDPHRSPAEAFIEPFDELVRQTAAILT